MIMAMNYVNNNPFDSANHHPTKPFWNYISENDAWSALAGVAAFYSTLFVSTLAQQKLGFTTASRPPVPTALGITSVCIASLASHHAAVSTQKYLRYGRWSKVNNRGSSMSTASSWLFPPDHTPMLHTQYVQIPLHTIRICCLGLVTFKMLGGRFWALAPSSYTHMGSFARVFWGSLPATHQYASAAKRLRLERLGRRIGCHTCGTHKFLSLDAFSFVGDHQPPKAIAAQVNQRLHRRLLNWKVAYKFFPQCRDCSAIQGSILSKATTEMRAIHHHPVRSSSNLLNGQSTFFAHVRGSPSYFHGWRPRFNHLTGAIIGSMAVLGASDYDLDRGNPAQYDRLSQQSIHVAQSIRTKLREWFCVD